MNAENLAPLPYDSQVRLWERWYEGKMRMEERKIECNISEQHQLEVYRQKKTLLSATKSRVGRHMMLLWRTMMASSFWKEKMH